MKTRGLVLLALVASAGGRAFGQCDTADPNFSSFGFTPAHDAFWLPPPGRLRRMNWLADATAVMSRPVIFTLSPGLTIVRLPELSDS